MPDGSSTRSAGERCRRTARKRATSGAIGAAAAARRWSIGGGEPAGELEREAERCGERRDDQLPEPQGLTARAAAKARNGVGRAAR